MAKRIRPAKHYQRSDNVVRKLVLQTRRPVARELRQAFGHLGEMVPAGRIEPLIRSGQLRVIFDQINWRHYREILKKPFNRIGNAWNDGAALGVRKINAIHTRHGRKVRFRKAIGDRFNFDLYDENTQAKLRAAQDELIQQLEESARDAIETIVMDGAMEGLSAEEIVDDIRMMIGLTDTQAQAVLNYRGMLENSDAGALTRQLRNSTMDDALRQAIDDGTFLDADVIDQMVSDYTDNYLDYRASTIAQTESVRAINGGLHDAYSQAIERGALPDDAVRREWELGDEPCPICESIPDNNPDGVGVDEEFESDDGPVDDPPVHPNCMCSVNYITDISMVPDDSEDDSGSYDTAGNLADEFA